MMLALQRRRMSRSPSTTMLDMDASVAIGVMTAMTILLMMAPANVTIRWMMLMNDDGNDVQNGNDGHKTSLPPTKKVTTTAMTTTEMTSATIPSKMMGPFLPPPIADNSWTCRLPALCQTCSPLTTLADPTAANPQRLCPPPGDFHLAFFVLLHPRPHLCALTPFTQKKEFERF